MTVLYTISAILSYFEKIDFALFPQTYLPHVRHYRYQSRENIEHAAVHTRVVPKQSLMPHMYTASILKEFRGTEVELAVCLKEMLACLCSLPFSITQVRLSSQIITKPRNEKALLVTTDSKLKQTLPSALH